MAEKDHKKAKSKKLKFSATFFEQKCQINKFQTRCQSKDHTHKLECENPISVNFNI